MGHVLRRYRAMIEGERRLAFAFKSLIDCWSQKGPGAIR